MHLVNKKTLIISTALLMLVGCYKESDYLLSDAEKFDQINCVISLTPSKAKLLANGADESTIRVELSGKYYGSITSLLLTTTNGKFKESGKDSLNIESFGLEKQGDTLIMSKVVTYVSSTTPDSTVNLYVNTLGLQKQISLQLDPVFPIKLNPVGIEPYYISGDSIQEIDVSVKLVSENNKLASEEKSVWFEAMGNHGKFKSEVVTSNSASVAQTKYVFSDRNYKGTIRFRAKALNANGDTIRSEGILNVF